MKKDVTRLKCCVEPLTHSLAVTSFYSTKHGACAHLWTTTGPSEGVVFSRREMKRLRRVLDQILAEHDR